jgi:hypothetical protein
MQCSIAQNATSTRLLTKKTFITLLKMEVRLGSQSCLISNLRQISAFEVVRIHPLPPICLSSARMQRKKPNSWKSDAEALKDRYDGLGNQLRTQYEHTVENLKQVFTPDELYFGIYENMFQSTELKNLSDFLGIPFNKSLVDVRLNESRLIEDIPIELKAEVKEFYSNTYEYCYKNFTETKCLWL